MLNLDLFFYQLKQLNINFITGVPDSLLNNFCLYAQDNLSKTQHVITANEGNAVALAAGNYFATGNIPLVYMQNSGIGNALNPLLSLTNKEVYGIPMILLIGWRGEPDVSDWAHHKLQGKLTPVLLNDMEIPYEILEDNEEAYTSLQWAVNKALEINSPVALVAKKGVFNVKDKEQIVDSRTNLLNREEAMKTIVKLLPKDTVYVVTTGRATREIVEVKNQLHLPHDLDILNVGAMGHASSIALGIALGKPEKLVVCFDGDAAALMHMGSLAINGSIQPNNLLHIVLNNGVHESVGGQNTVAQQINFTKIAENVGYKTIGQHISSEQQLTKSIQSLLNTNQAGFMDLHIRKGIRSDIPTLKVSLKEIKQNFRNAIEH